MENQKEKKGAYERTSERRDYTKRGEGSSQKMMSFRLDNELKDFMDGISNKGRLINNLLMKYKKQIERKAKVEEADEHDPVEPIGDYEE